MPTLAGTALNFPRIKGDQRRSRMLLAMLAFIAPVSAMRAQVQERLTSWTHPVFPVAEYSARRAAALRLLGSDDMLLIPGSDGTSSGDTFRQSNNFEYFAGLEIPRALLIVDGRTKTSWLVVPPRDPNFFNAGRPNDFPGRLLASDPSVRALSGVDSVLADDELPQLIRAMITSGRHLRIDSGRSSGDATVPSPFATPTPGDLLTSYIRREFPGATIDNAYALIASLRMVKSPRELALLRETARVTSVAIARGAARVIPGTDERTLTGEFSADCMALGAQRVAFTPIIKSGDNSLWPWRILGAHYDRRNRTLRRGELVIFDVGCEREHYVSDVGRTFPVGDRFTATQRALVELVRGISDAVIAAARPGTTLAALQAVAQSAIPPDARPYMRAPLYFGHHIGLDAGDPSIVSATLAPGMVFTVEPWYYNHVDGVAVFIEDEILITPTGSENLTAGLPRDADGLEAMRRGRMGALTHADAGRSITRDGVLSFTIDRAARSVRVYDLLNGVDVAATQVCATPIDGALSADDIVFTVRCAGLARTISINTASFAVVAGVPPAARARRSPIGSARAGGRKNEVIVVGTIHGEHRTSTRYSTDVLRRLLIAMRPDYVLTEIAPNRLQAAMAEFTATGTITEPRVMRFPEYVDVLFPLSRTMAFGIVPTAGWTRPMDLFRTAALKRIEADPTRRAEWMEYDRANKRADSVVATHGADDPYYINSASYDSVQTAAHEPYNRLFNSELGPGGWDNINRTHFGNIARALDTHRGEGTRFVITYGAGHKEWFLRELRKRDDITILDVAPFLDAIRH
jgi:Xaa-Pro aminopeptidase